MRARIGLCAVVAFALVAVPSAAQKVGNPTTSLGATIASASLVAGNGGQIQDSLTGPLELLHGATITKTGAITVPEATIDHVPFKLPDQSSSSNGCTYSETNGSVTVIPTAPATGHLNPFTGAATLTVTFYLKGTYTLNYSCFGNPGSYTPSDCQIGSAGSPLQLNLTTGTTAPNPPNTPIHGAAYSDRTGKLTVVDNSFSLPSSSGCDPQVGGFTLTGAFDQAAGLPAPDGNNTLMVTGNLSPIIKRGVQAKLVATPGSGFAPLTVHFSASKSFAPAGVKSYSFSFGDGKHQIGSSPTATHTYAKPARYTATLTVTDKDGDHDTSKLIIVVKKRT